MMLNQLSKILILLVCVFSFAAAPSEIITDFNDESVPVLNDVLRKMQEQIQDSVDTDIYVKGSASDTAGYLDSKVKNSIVVDSSKLQLSGDAASPGNSQLYGTNSSGTKGWYAQSTTTSGRELFTSSGTFTAPTGITKVYLTMCGGGGGGDEGSGAGAGGGGGGASVIKYPYTVIGGNNYTVTIGAAGDGGTSPTAGGDTVFDSLTVKGGGAASNGTGGTGGAGGYNAATTTGGTGKIAGGNGATVSNPNTGGGGSSAFGVGGDAGGGTGAVGTGFGSGGGGGTSNGGAGSVGFVLIEY